MRTPSHQIASFLLSVFLLGSVAVPVVHPIAHALEAVDAEDLGHVHPDYAALLDCSTHELDTHLDCVLCSNRLERYVSTYTFLPAPPKWLRARLIEVANHPAPVSFGGQTVRGPPVA